MKPLNTLAVVSLAVVLGAGGGYWYAQSHVPGMRTNPEQAAAPQDKGAAQEGAGQDTRKVLYWYDPMYPQQKFDQPGKSPFMDMELVPRYAGAESDTAAISIDPRSSQNLGMRLATVTRSAPASRLEVTGVLAFNERQIAVIQPRSGGFVERVYARAAGDVLPAKAPLVDLLIPDWAAAQEEFLALKRLDEAELLIAGRQRLRLMGMPPELIGQVERSGHVRPVLTVTSPIGGVLQELNVRAGMTVSAGDTLARVNDLSSVWLAVAVPEAEADAIAVDQPVDAQLPAFPGDVVQGVVSAILPETNPDSRTLHVRVELPNPDGRLRPGMTAQVSLNRSAGPAALWVPSEAVIRTGRRALVMLAEGGGRYRPVDVQLGRESIDRTAVLQGLEEGQQVVVSGQFLLDSEASLKGLVAPADEPSASATKPAALHEADGKVIAIEASGITLAHGPFASLGMPGMTMTFPLANPDLLAGIQVGDRVHVAVHQTDDGLLVERVVKRGGQP